MFVSKSTPNKSEMSQGVIVLIVAKPELWVKSSNYFCVKLQCESDVKPTPGARQPIKVTFSSF